MNKQYYIGIDISKRTLDVRLYFHENNNLSENHTQISNDEKGFKALLKWLKTKKIQLPELVICMEHTGLYGLEISQFLEENNIDYSMISAYHIKHSLGIMRGKNDNIDAGRIARYCYLHRDELVYTRSKSRSLLRIRELFVERKQYVKKLAKCKSYITESKKKPVSSTQSRCIEELSIINRFLALIEKEILELIKSDSDLYKNYELITTIKGVSLVNAVNILLYTNNFTSFRNARSYACYIGVAPFGYQSGTSLNTKGKVSKMANRSLKVDLSQAALSAVSHDAEIKAYYKRKIASGKATGVVLNAVKFKLIERMFAVVKRGTPFVSMSNHLN